MASEVCKSLGSSSTVKGRLMRGMELLSEFAGTFPGRLLRMFAGRLPRILAGMLQGMLPVLPAPRISCRRGGILGSLSWDVVSSEWVHA